MKLYPKIQIPADLNNIIQVYFIIYEIIICLLRDDYLKENVPCDSQTDTFLCPNGKLPVFKEETRVENRNTFKSFLRRRYECEGCSGCATSINAEVKEKKAAIAAFG